MCIPSVGALEVSCHNCGGPVKVLTRSVACSFEHRIILQCQASNCRRQWMLLVTLSAVQNPDTEQRRKYRKADRRPTHAKRVPA